MKKSTFKIGQKRLSSQIKNQVIGQESEQPFNIWINKPLSLFRLQVNLSINLSLHNSSLTLMHI